MGIKLDIDLSSCYPVSMSLLHMYEPNKSSITKVKKAVESFNGTELLIGCADVTFMFPDDCMYPNLSIRDDKFGLVQVLQGRCVATITELHLALFLKAKIEYHDGFVFENMKDKKGNKIALFKDHVKQHINARNQAKRDGNKLLQNLIKLYNNGLYGKVCQGINEKKKYDYVNGYSKVLSPSSITNPFLGMTITGFIRAVLSSMIIAIEHLKNEGLNYEVISATTDGLLYKSPISSIQSIIDIKQLKANYNDDLKKAFASGDNDFLKPLKILDPLLYDKFLEFPAIKLFKITANELTPEKDYIEIKHVAENLRNYKTRAQTGTVTINGTVIATILARGGSKLDGAKERQIDQLEEWFNSTKIEKNDIQVLAGVRDILQSNSQLDLVSIPKSSKVNLDYEYKRYLLDEGYTKPFKNMDEMRKHRGCSDYLRKQGIRASKYMIDFAVHRAKQNVQNRGSKRQMVRRHLLRALVQGIFPFSKNNMTYKETAEILVDFLVTVDMLKDANRKAFKANVISNDSKSRKIIREMISLLGYKKVDYERFYDLLIFKGTSNLKNIDIEEVIDGK